jgi:DNA repair photolyase
MMMAKRFGKIKSYNDWIKPAIVSNSLELLDLEIPKYKDQIKFVHLSFTTDPFMYNYPEVSDLTLKIVEKLNKHRIKSSILTKGIYPRILEDKIKYGFDNIYGITLVSLDEKFRKSFEPFSAPFEERIKALEYLHNAGLKTWISMEPYPTPNLIAQDLTEILERISFVDRIIFGKLNYNVNVSEFEGNVNFYEKCSNTVIGFCKKNKIEYHVKCGTQREYNKKTEIVLSA